MKRTVAILFVVLAAIAIWLITGNDVDGSPSTVPWVPIVSGLPVVPTPETGSEPSVRVDAQPVPGNQSSTPLPSNAASTGDVRITLMRKTASALQAAGAGHAIAIEPASAIDPWAERQERCTDSHGVAEIRLQPGRWQASTGGGAIVEFDVVAAHTQQVQLMLVDGYRVEGLVTDPDGRAIADAEVVGGDSADRLLAIGRTDADGRFAIEPLRGHRLVAVSHPWFAASTARPVHGAIGDVVPLRFLLAPNAGQLKVTVVGAIGMPVPGALCALTPTARDGNPARTFVLATANDGTMASPPLPAGPVRLQVRARGHGSWSDHGAIEAGTTANLTVHLPRPASILGIAKNTAGEPILARIWSGDSRSFASQTTTTAADGTFRLEDLGPGEVALHARAAGHQDVEGTRMLVAGSEARWDIEFEGADPERSLAGRVIDHRGQPLAGWRVVAQDLGPGARGVGKNTMPDGTFALHGLPRGGRMRVTARPTGTDLMAFAAAMLDDVPVGSRELELRVEDPQLAMGAIAGTITEANGRGVAARIDIWHDSGRSASYRANDAGRFDLAGIPVGKVDLRWSHPDHPTRVMNEAMVQPGATLDLGTLQFAPPAFVSGTLVGPGGSQPAAATIRLLDGQGATAATAELQGTSWHATPVAPGNYRVQVQADGCAPASAPVTVAAGERKELRIELRVGVARRIRVRAPAGADCGSWVSLAVADEHGERLWEAGLPLSDGTAEFLVFMPAGNHPIAVRARRGWQAQALVPFASGDHPTLDLELAQRP